LRTPATLATACSCRPHCDHKPQQHCRNDAILFLKCSKESARRRISRVLSRPGRGRLERGWPFLWDARCQAPRATDPSGGAEARPASRFSETPAAPTWSCSRWGLPCRRRRRQRGALLPHRFTLAGGPAFPGPAGGVLSVALSLGSPPPGVTRHRTSVEPGLSSLRPTRRAAIQPSGRDYMWVPPAHIKDAAGSWQTGGKARARRPRRRPGSRPPRAPGSVSRPAPARRSRPP
jgi:hypothetical protein